MLRSTLPAVKVGDTIQILCVKYNPEVGMRVLCVEDLKNHGPPTYLSQEERENWVNRPGWGLPGGGVQEGEDVLAATDRELREETGHTLIARDSNHLPAKGPDGKVIALDGINFSLVYVEERIHDETRETSHLYILICTYVPEMGTIKVNDPEDKVIQAAWVDFWSLEDLCDGYIKLGHVPDDWELRHFYHSHIRRLAEIFKITA